MPLFQLPDSRKGRAIQNKETKVIDMGFKWVGIIIWAITVFTIIFTTVSLVPMATTPCPNAEKIASLIEIPACPKTPDCNATCNAVSTCKRTNFEGGCHLPKHIFERNITIRSYTGVSNIPSLFAGNELLAVKIQNKDLFTGCFYEFTYNNELVLHRLIGIYNGYLLFKGDNNDTTERVKFDDLKYLIVGVNFK